MAHRARVALLLGIVGVGLTMAGIVLPQRVVSVLGIVLMISAWAAAVWWHAGAEAEDAEIERQDDAWRRWWC